MEMPKPINQTEIDEITARYERQIAETPELEAVFRVQCESEVSAAIGRQRKEALEQGGELAERIKAENEEIMRSAQELRSQISDADMQAAREAVDKQKASLEAEKALSGNSGAAVKNKFCTNCGAKLSEGAKFCVECGVRIG